VFLIGVSAADLDALRSRVAGDRALEIVGAGLKTDIDRGSMSIRSDVDAVLMSPRALGTPARVDVRSEPDEPRAPRLIEALTPRERDVLALLADGHGNRAIATELGISEHTVKFHLAAIFGKLGASNRTEAVRRGLELGLVEI